MKYRIEIETDEPFADMAILNAADSLRAEIGDESTKVETFITTDDGVTERLS